MFLFFIIRVLGCPPNKKIDRQTEDNFGNMWTHIAVLAIIQFLMIIF